MWNSIILKPKWLTHDRHKHECENSKLELCSTTGYLSSTSTEDFIVWLSWSWPLQMKMSLSKRINVVWLVCFEWCCVSKTCVKNQQQTSASDLHSGMRILCASQQCTQLWNQKIIARFFQSLDSKHGGTALQCSGLLQAINKHDYRVIKRSCAAWHDKRTSWAQTRKWQGEC